MKQKDERKNKFIGKALNKDIRFKLAQNVHYKNKDLIEALTWLASTQSFVEGGACFLREVKDAPSPDTLFFQLNKFKPEEVLETFEQVLLKQYKLAKKLGIFRRKVVLAIDIHDIPYYGNKNDKMVVGTKRKLGTSYAYRFITMNIVEKGKRLTLAALPMSQLDQKEKMVEKLVKLAKRLVRLKIVLLDRGFFSVRIINTLKRMGVKFIMPAIANPKIQKLMDSPKTTDYEMENAYHETTKFKLLVVEGKKGLVPFATNVAKNIYYLVPGIYRKRWGIETSYRVKKEFRPRTCTKSYVARLFFFLFSVCFYNLWILINMLVGIETSGRIPKKPLISARRLKFLFVFGVFNTPSKPNA